MTKRDLINYCQLTFMNGMNDAISVIALHKVFVVLFTGNIIFLITDLASHFAFKDCVRISLLINFVISDVIILKYITPKSIHFKSLFAIFFVCLYALSGIIATNTHHISENSFGFFIVANIAAFTSIMINNIFYRFDKTQFNLMLYTMNIIKLIGFFTRKQYKEAHSLFLTFSCFILGLLTAAFAVTYWHFYAVLIMLPILIYLHITNHADRKSNPSD